ncbi:unnamed protein product [Penicillium salamii]|nr:unnamed protein product [Penicillium salamii]CAG8096436.1 unnamed protein product [Penicillium salamii]CAG8362555.1 unnamed protein product [Penicillium salamii]
MAARDTQHLLASLMETAVQVNKYHLFTIIINKALDISKITHGARKDYSTLNVDACSTESGRPVAWIEVNDNRIVEFFNQNRDQTGCTLENGLKVGSSYIASKLPSAPSPLTSSALEPSLSVSSSLASSSSESSSSASSSSEASPSTATASSDLISSCTGFE